MTSEVLSALLLCDVIFLYTPHNNLFLRLTVISPFCAEEPPFLWEQAHEEEKLYEQRKLITIVT